MHCNLTVFLALFLSTAAAFADLAWPQKTGPFSNGTARPADAQGLPASWDESTGKNIVWKVPLPHLGHSTPVIGNGRIWITSATEDGKRQFVECLDVESGEAIHQRLIFENDTPEPLGNPVNSYASPTCVLTNDAVYVHFGTYGTARLDPVTADVQWQRRDIHCRHFRGPGSSPILFQNLLILTFDGIDQQFLTALDKDTGATVWRTDRTTDYGDLDENGNPHLEGDLRKAYSTPAIAHANGSPQVVSVGSRAAFGYDARTGREIWTVTHDDYNAAAQPLTFQDTVILNTGSRAANLLAVRLAESTIGDVSDSHVIWNRPKGNSRLCFPVLHKGSIYSITDNGVMTAIDAASGKEIWTGRTRGNFISSPVVANELLYVFNQEGEATVLKTGAAFEVVSRNKLQEGGKASPAVAQGALFLRTTHHLYKIARER